MWLTDANPRRLFFASYTLLRLKKNATEKKCDVSHFFPVDAFDYKTVSYEV